MPIRTVESKRQLQQSDVTLTDEPYEPIHGQDREDEDLRMDMLFPTQQEKEPAPKLTPVIYAGSGKTKEPAEWP